MLYTQASGERDLFSFSYFTFDARRIYWDKKLNYEFMTKTFCAQY